MRSGAEVQALTRLVLARLELTPPPNFFTVAIQQPGNSYPLSRLSLLLNWEDTRVLDRANRPVQLRVKEALYIQKTPTNNRHFNTNKYKKQLKNCRGKYRDGRIKKYTNKSGRDNSRQNASLHTFS